MRVPVAQTLAREDRVMLSLYYRWAVHVLSAFSFMHSKSVYIKFFSAQLVWLRSDYSLAITGFISASAPEIEAELKRDAAQEVQTAKRENADFWAANPDLAKKAIGQFAEPSDWQWDEGEIAGNEEITYDEISGCINGGCAKEDLSVFNYASSI
jgi:hypothetical protein